MKSTELTNNNRIDNVEVTKVSSGLNLYFELDGVPTTVTGEFHIDNKNILHHTAIDAEGNEIEVLVKLEF